MPWPILYGRPPTASLLWTMPLPATLRGAPLLGGRLSPVAPVYSRSVTAQYLTSTVNGNIHQPCLCHEIGTTGLQCLSNMTNGMTLESWFTIQYGSQVASTHSQDDNWKKSIFATDKWLSKKLTSQISTSTANGLPATQMRTKHLTGNVHT